MDALADVLQHQASDDKNGRNEEVQASTDKVCDRHRHELVAARPSAQPGALAATRDAEEQI